MRQAYIFLILGIWLVVLPYLGFPHAWKGMLTTLTGLIIGCLSYMSYREAKIKELREARTFENFSENSFNGEEEKIN